MIYFDNAATTFPKPECVYQALDQANRTMAFNAGHGESKESEAALLTVTKARRLVASFIPFVSPNQVVFTCSATEALNLIILGLPLERGDTVYVSPFEHNAIIRPLHLLETEKGIHVRVLPFNPKDWKLDEDKLADMFAVNPPAAVFMSQISNVTGYELPYSVVFKASQKLGAINVLDAAQGYGVFPIVNPALCSYIIFAGHKSLYGSFGVAGFIKITSKPLKVIKSGGTGSDSLNPEMPSNEPARYEAGSLNVVAISSLLASIEWLKGQDIAAHERMLAGYFREKIKELPNVIDYQPSSVVCNGIVSFGVRGMLPSDVGLILGDKGISVRTGYHCAPLVHRFIGSEDSGGTVRCSFGAFNSCDEIDILIKILREM